MAAATAPNVAETPSGSTSPAAASVVPHPWSQVVRGNPDGYSPCALPLSSSPSPPSNSPISSRVVSDPVVEDGVTSSAEAAGTRPINESVESGLAVIGGVAAWPALPESSNPTYKSPCSSGGPTNTVPAPPSGPGSSGSSPKPDLNPSSIERQKSMERGGVSSDGASSCASAALASSPPILAHTPEANAEKKSPTELVLQGLTTNVTTSSNHGSRGGRSGSQIHDSGDHHRSYGSNRRWNSGGGSGIHDIYASRRDQEHVNYNGFRRNAGGRGIHVQHRGAWSNFRPIPQPAVPVCSVYHPQFPNFGYPVVFPDMPYPLYYVPNQPHPGSMPYVHQRPVARPVSIRNTDAQRSSLLQQIEYYFSEVNLRTDGYLQSKMDEQGWVPASLIAGFNRVLEFSFTSLGELCILSANINDGEIFSFDCSHWSVCSGKNSISYYIHLINKVKKITNKLEFILDTMRSSTEVEVKGDKMRKRHNWKEFLPKNELVGNISSSPVTFNSGHRAARMQTVELEGASDSGSGSPGVASQNGAVFSRLVSLNPSRPLHKAVHPNFDSDGQVAAAAAISDQTISGRE